MAKARAQLLTPDGIKPVTGGNITHTTNQGVNGKVVLKTPISLDALREGSVQLQIENTQDAYESPPMRAQVRERAKTSAGRTWTLDLIDEPRWKMAKPGQSLPTFVNSSSTSILNALAAPAGINVVGMPNLPVLVEDFKQSTFEAGLRRLAAAAAQEWRIGPDGSVVLAPVMWSSGGLTFRSGTEGYVRERGNVARRFTGLRIEKSSPIQNSFCFTIDPDTSAEESYHTVKFGNPLRNVVYSENGVSGCSVTVVILWSGPPGEPGSVVVKAWSSVDVSGPVDGTLPATHATFVLQPTAQAIENGIPATATLCFHGSPVDMLPGVDLSFSVFVGTNERPCPDVYNEPLVPTRAAAIANGPGYLRQRNKDAYRVLAGGKLRLDTELAATMTVEEEDGWPLSRVETFTHNIADSGFTTNVEGCIFEDLE